MKIGYARVSTPTQVESLAAQRAELEAAGCECVFTDVVSGAKVDRPGLTAKQIRRKRVKTVLVMNEYAYATRINDHLAKLD